MLIQQQRLGRYTELEPVNCDPVPRALSRLRSCAHHDVIHHGPTLDQGRLELRVAVHPVVHRSGSSMEESRYLVHRHPRGVVLQVALEHIGDSILVFRPHPLLGAVLPEAVFIVCLNRSLGADEGLPTNHYIIRGCT